MNNYFTVSSGNARIIAKSDMTNAFSYWQNGYAYAAYICIIGGTHRLDKKAILVSYNDNVGKGELYYKCGANVTLKEFPHKITGIGLAPYPGAEPSCLSEVDFYPSRTDICATVSLDAKTADFSFYPGENPLVQSLLGLRAFPDPVVKGGLFQSGSGAFVAPLSQNVVSSSPVSGDKGSGVTFNAHDYTEYTVFADEKPCARINLSFVTSTGKQKTVSCAGGFYTDAISVDHVQVGVHPLQFNTCKCITGIYETGRDIAGDFTGFEFFSDPMCKHVGMKNGKEFWLFDGTTFNKCGAYSGELMLCSDGEVVEIADGTVKFFSLDKTVKVNKGKTIVFSREGGYDIFVYSTEYLYFYRLESELSQPTVHSVIPGSEFYRANDYMVIISNKEHASNEMYYYDGMANFFTEQLAFTRGLGYRDGCYYGNGFMGSFINNNRISCSKAKGRFCINDGKLYFVGENGITLLSDSFDFSDAALAGDKAMFIRNGKLEIYATSWSGEYVSIPYGGYVDYTVREWTKPSCDVTLRIDKSAI